MKYEIGDRFVSTDRPDPLGEYVLAQLSGDGLINLININNGCRFDSDGVRMGSDNEVPPELLKELIGDTFSQWYRKVKTGDVVSLERCIDQMSKQKSAIVSIIGYDPVDDKAGVGGFDWYYDRLDAMTRLHECLENEGGTHFIWFRAYKVNVTGDKKADQITINDVIEKNIMDHGSDGDWN